jgi:hypothetical protein
LLTHTKQWIVELIVNHQLPNTTVLMAGREQEGRFFFERLENLSAHEGLDQKISHQTLCWV